MKLVIGVMILPLIVFFAIIYHRRSYNVKPRLIFGPIPLINNKYWSNALREIGFDSRTLMDGYYGTINAKDDFDLYYDSFNLFNYRHLDSFITPYRVFLHVLRNADIVHLPFSGGFLYKTSLRWMEPFFYKLAGIKTVMIPFGSDSYMYSRVMDASLRHVLLSWLPQFGRFEEKIRKQIEFFMKHADFVIMGSMIDGMQRWDILAFNPLSVDTDEWQYVERADNTEKNGINKEVIIIHTPNNRGFKGTEFLIDSVNKLKQEGLRVSLLMMEKRQNAEVKEAMNHVDILAEQFIAPCYALSGIEGMAKGLPVLSN
ncbi:MAG TPA: hypothetical protein VNJ07_03490, partial [Chitinophagales bacterium]|nr:hypothetical protein [Chitinophagales bacterium]